MGARRWLCAVRWKNSTCRLLKIVDALKTGTFADRPIEGHRRHAQRALDFIEQVEGVATGLVHLVDERQDRDAAFAADGKELFRLGLDTFGAIEHHDGTIHRHERAVRVFAEILVARRVEEIDARSLIVELQHGRGDRDSPRLLQLHPVRLRLPLAGTCLYGSGQMHGPRIEQQFFRQRGFSRVRVRNDGERAASGDFSRNSSDADCSAGKDIEVLQVVCQSNGGGTKNVGSRQGNLFFYQSDGGRRQGEGREGGLMVPMLAQRAA